MRLNYKVYGQGEPLIILHGLFGALDNWHSISLRLAGLFQVIAVDQRNHGRSPHYPEMDYHLMGKDLLWLLEELELEQAHVMGHSMGGKTAMEFALQSPVKVRKLLVVDMAPRTYPPSHNEIFQALLALDPARFASRKAMEDALAGSIPEPALRQFLLKNVERTAANQFRWRMGLREIHANYDRLREAIPAGRAFAGPSLFVRGERSGYLTETDLPEIRKRFPSARLETIANAGHLVHIENPEAFLAVVAGFLNEP